MERRGLSGTVRRAVTSMISMIVCAAIAHLLTLLMQRIEHSGTSSDYNSYEKQLLECRLDPKRLDVTLDDVGGLSAVKRELQLGLILPLSNPKAFFTSRCLCPSRGILFTGAPGTGKTMLGKAIAKECGVPFISITLGHLENKYFGESSKLLAAAFSLARKLQPVILFFDEIDGMVKKRSGEDQQCTYSFKTEFLAQMDGMGNGQTDAVFVIGTTNNASALDAAMKRRLPRVYDIGLPDASERVAILRSCMRDEPGPRLDTSTWLGGATRTMSGSDLHELYRIAASLRLSEQLDDDSVRQALTDGGTLDGLLRPIAKEEWTQALQRFSSSKRIAETTHCDAPTKIDTVLQEKTRA